MRTLALLLSATLAVTACGFKGPLYLPGQKPAKKTSAPATPKPAAPTDSTAPAGTPDQTNPQ